MNPHEIDESSPEGGQSQRGGAWRRGSLSGVGYLEGFLIRREAGPILGFAILAAIFQFMSGQFLSSDEMSAIVTLGAPISIIAVGVAFLMVSGEFDLSVGGVYPLAAILLGELLQIGWNQWVSMAVVLVTCAAIGFGNGFITTTFRIPSLITTLAALYILRGVAYFVTNGQTVLIFTSSALFTVLGARIGTSFVTAPVLWALGIVIVMWFVLQHTRYGNWTFAAGSRNDSPRAMGVPSSRVKTINFMISAVLTGFAGCAQFASFGGASPGNGTGYELLAIVACVIGGTSLFGVRGTVVGAAIGALTVSALQSGLVLVGMPGNAYTSLIGVILIVAVILNQRVAEISGISRRLAPRLDGPKVNRP